jgi:homoaconitase/3-isopropylmalate dehydratase large subunit
MGAEVGATTSTFPYTENMRAYLNATGRAPLARAADKAASMGFLNADEGAEYDKVIEIVRSSFIQRTRYLIRIYRICPNLNQLLTVLSLLI